MLARDQKPRAAGEGPEDLERPAKDLELGHW